MSELTPEQEDDLRFLAVADTVPLHMRQRLLAALAEIDRLRQRVADLTAGLRGCDVVMDTAALHGLPQQLPPAYCDSWAAAHTTAARLLAEDRP